MHYSRSGFFRRRRPATRRCRGLSSSRTLQFQTLEQKLALTGSSIDLSIYVEGDSVEIPALVGVQQDESRAETYTLANDGRVYFDDFGVTLGDFFQVWQTGAGQAGNDPEAVLSQTQVLEYETDFDTTLQVFVDGQVVTDFVNYEFLGLEQVDIVYSTNPVVSINTNFGNILVELYENETPLSVDNFLFYVNEGRYNESFFHRSSAPNNVIQAGGFTTDSTVLDDDTDIDVVSTRGNVQNESGIDNTTGTIGLARDPDDVDSANSQFYFNTADNPGFDGLFAVFGQALSLTTIQSIFSLPVSMFARPFNELPLEDGDTFAVISSVEGQGELAGTAYFDLDSDGEQDDNEVGIEGARVFLDEDGGGTFDEGETFVLTDSQGRYLLQAPPGDYTVRIEQLAGTVFSDSEAEAGYLRTIEIGREVSGLDFALDPRDTPASVDLLASFDTGIFDDDNLTNLNNDTDNTLIFRVRGLVPGALVSLYANETLIGTAVADDSRTNVRTDGTTILEDGTYQITATMTFGDVEGEASNPLEVTIDSNVEFTSTPPSTVRVGDLFTYDAESSEEGDPGVSYSALATPEGLTFDPTTGAVSWQTSLEDEGTVTFAMTVEDAAGNSAAQAVSLTVLGPLPVFPDQYRVDEDDSLTVSAEQGVLSNDGDELSGSLAATLVDGPENGQFDFSSDGSFSYTPNENYSGEDSFTYFASDGDIVGNVTTVTIFVDPVQDEPVPLGDEYTVDEDGTLTVDADAGVLSNDTDADDQQLTAALSVGPANGVLDLDEDGSFVYTPNANFNGTDTFTYAVSDGTDEVEATVTINVNSIPDDPAAVGDVITVAIDAGQQELEVLENDTTEPDGEQEFRIVSFTQGDEGGTVELGPAGQSLLYTPRDSFLGTDTFEYTIEDADGLTDSATVVVNIIEDSTGVIAGTVFLDIDGDGEAGGSEPGIPGVLITLTGTSSTDNQIQRTAITDDSGAYSFDELPRGVYEVTQSQPTLYEDGDESSDSPNAVVGVDEVSGNDQISNLVLEGEEGTNEYVANNFGELRVESNYVNVAWFFASNVGDEDYIIRVIANAEEAAGNSDLAEAIRSRRTTLDTVDETEPLSQNAFLVEEDAEESDDPLAADADLDEEETELASEPESAVQDTVLEEDSDTVLEPTSVVEDLLLEEEEDSQQFDSSLDEALEDTSNWLEL